MELRLKLAELIERPAKSKDGREFTVYQADADGYALDLQMTKADRDMIDKLFADHKTASILIFKLSSREFEYNGRKIKVPTASFVKVE
jgi:hypothetical protein